MNRLRVILRVCSAMFVLMTALPSDTDAQGGPPPPADGRRGKRGTVSRDDMPRGMLEQRFQQRLETVVRQRLQLTDEQMSKLRDVAGRTESARRALRADEMMTRRAMRTELLAGDNANDARVAELLEQMPRLERRRLDLMEQEQKELARFLSPVQRARYFALQEELRRGMQDVQRRRLMTDSALPGGRNETGITRRRPPR